jgi:hypothetical protein
VGGEIDLAERALPDQPAEGIVSDRLEVLVGEFAASAVSADRTGVELAVSLLEKLLVRLRKLRRWSVLSKLVTGQTGQTHLGLAPKRLGLHLCRLHPSTAAGQSQVVIRGSLAQLLTGKARVTVRESKSVDRVVRSGHQGRCRQIWRRDRCRGLGRWQAESK